MSQPSGRAATPAEKRAVIERLYASWLLCPDMRLGQLIGNALSAERREANAIRHIEDRDVAELVERFAERHRS